MSTKKPKRGRPSLGAAAQSVVVTLRITAEQAQTWARSAGKAPLSEWIRATCNARALDS